MSRFQVPDVDDPAVRFVLGERWSVGPMVGFAGMNPSTAGLAATDPSWSRWRGFAQRWGAGGMLVVNPVPLRSPDPDAAIAILREMVNGRASWAAEHMAANLAHLSKYGDKACAWVIGWGDKGAAMNAVARCHRNALEALKGGSDAPFLSFGLTASGNPIHVLARGKGRLPDDAPLYEFHPNWRGPGPRFDIVAMIAGRRGQGAIEIEP